MPSTAVGHTPRMTGDENPAIGHAIDFEVRHTPQMRGDGKGREEEKRGPAAQDGHTLG